MSLPFVADKAPRFPTVSAYCEQIRLVEGRDRPIDRLAKNVLLFGEQDEGEDDVRYVAESCVLVASTGTWYSSAMQSCKHIGGRSSTILSVDGRFCFTPYICRRVFDEGVVRVNLVGEHVLRAT